MDMNLHIPQQIENMLNAIAEGDQNGITISIDNVVDLVKDPDFKAQLDFYEKEWRKKTNEIENNVVNKLKHNAELKTLDDAMEIINEGLQRSNVTYGNYIKTIKTYILRYLHTLD